MIDLPTNETSRQLKVDSAFELFIGHPAFAGNLVFSMTTALCGPMELHATYCAPYMKWDEAAKCASILEAHGFQEEANLFHIFQEKLCEYRKSNERNSEYKALFPYMLRAVRSIFVPELENDGKNTDKIVTTGNLMDCLLSNGLIFNVHHKYFELNSVVFRGHIEGVSDELRADAIILSLFYHGNMFSNKKASNYIMPFTAEELGCAKNDLNVLFPQDVQSDLFNRSIKETPFDFREFLKQFSFSKEAKDLYRAALQIFRYYHSNPEYKNKNWNDSFYDITNAIMGKEINRRENAENRCSKGMFQTKRPRGPGFSQNTIKYVVPSSVVPIFEDFFAKREVLARKINKELLDAGLLLWERENIF